jgi:DinB superfamily
MAHFRAQEVVVAINASNAEWAALFVDFSRRKLLEQEWPRLKECVAALSDEQLWWRPNQASNSVGNLLLHLNGNVGQWIIAAFNRRADTRNRPLEFSERGPLAKAELLARLGSTLDQAGETLARLTPAELLATYEIQGYTVCGLEAVYQVVEHFSLHYGQIVYITKLFSGEDLGFYKELNRAGRPAPGAGPPAH